MKRDQPWIYSARFDGIFILGPSLFVTAVVLFFHAELEALKEIPPLVWLFLIVGIDVSHVYSTLFRTYLNREEIRKRQALYVLTPLICWIFGCFIYSIDSLLFWRVLAYLAVFHFIRQQYGFMMIYSRIDGASSKWSRFLDSFVIYLATLYPIIYWHCNRRQFEWFIKDDFIKIDLPLLAVGAGYIYAMTLVAYVIKEMFRFRSSRFCNIPKNLIVLGTASSWFVGIVGFDNDLAFTATNVVAHGVPYLALVWIYCHNQATIEGCQSSYKWPWLAELFRVRRLPFYLIILGILAFVEEGLWDGFVWREYDSLFRYFRFFSGLSDSDTLVWLVPLLALPQTTHYILDAFIWRMRTEETNWKQYLFHQTTAKRCQNL